MSYSFFKGIVTSDTHAGYSNKTIRIHEAFLADLKRTIEKEKVDVLFHAGDWSTNQQDQLRRTLKLFRQKIDIPIVCVFGNHDFWECNRYHRLPTWEAEQRRRLEWCKENGIHYVGDNNPFVYKDIIVLGFDGWYNHTNPPTNDLGTEGQGIHKFIEGVPAHVWLQRRAYLQLDQLLRVDTEPYRKVIGMTHFPPYTDHERYEVFCANLKYLEPLKEKCDVLLTGHSHKYVNRVEDGCHLMNAGTGYPPEKDPDAPRYDMPRFLMFEC